MRFATSSTRISVCDRPRLLATRAANGATFPTLRASVVEDIEAIELPPGYELIWDGEHASTVESQEGLVPGIVPAVVIILFIIVILFNAVRPPLIIIVTIPISNSSSWSTIIIF